MRRTALASFLMIAAACGPSVGNQPDGSGGDDGDGGGPGWPDARPQPPIGDAAPAKPCDKMDIVFIIDDSGSMAEEQTNLGANFPAFVQVLDTFTTAAGEPIDYRLAVTTTGRDVTTTISIMGLPPFTQTEQGANGEFQLGDNCGMTKRWIERMDPNVSSTFSCVANVGTSGPGWEMPLLASDLALTDRMAPGETNVGFLREDALLAIVILTDENDCSRLDDNFTVTTGGDVCDPSDPNLTPPADTLTMLDTLKGERGRWASAIIAGDTDCTSDFGNAVQATRLLEFANLAGPSNAVFSSICAGDLAAALNEALMTFDAACQAFPPIE